MQTEDFQEFAAQPVDEETKASIEQAQAAYHRGESLTLEQSNINLRERIEAWRKAQAELLIAK